MDKDAETNQVLSSSSMQEIKSNTPPQLLLNSPSVLLPQALPRPCRLESANVFSRFTLYWLSPLISTGYKKRLEESDLDALPTFLDSEKFGIAMEQNWEGGYTRVVKSLFLRDILEMVPFYLISAVSSIIVPLFVQEYLRTLSGTDTWGIGGWGVVGIMFGVSLISISSLNYSFLKASIFGVKLKNATSNMIFRKSIRLSSASRASVNGGDVLNLMSQDSERIFFATLLLHTLWYAILIVVLVAIVLLVQIGVSGLAAVLFALLLSPVTSKIARWVGIHKRKMLKFTDERVSFSAEILQGIQTVKMQSWESKIQEKIFNLRREEMVEGKKVLTFLAVNAWQVFVVPPLMAALCFAVLAGTRPDDLTVTTIYAVLAFLNTLVLPLDLIPRSAGSFAQAFVSIRRIEAFMKLQDVQDTAQSIMDSPTSTEKKNFDENQSTLSLKFQNCTFFWTKRKDEELDSKKRLKKKSRSERFAKSFSKGGMSFRGMSFRTRYLEEDDENSPHPSSPKMEMIDINVLSNINLDIFKNELIVVVGEVGSGKSSLLSAILGEIGVRPGGNIFKKGKNSPIAYVPQEPWIQYATLKDNVLFSKARPVNEELYQKVIKAVQMEHDLKTLPKGDLTEIGSKGINLSGGQKARVGLARAVYHALSEAEDDALIVCCDDPFSALDPAVATAVWAEVIQGLLKDITRVVCLNSNLNLASKADRIVVLENGTISAVGPPEEILKNEKFSWLFDARSATTHPENDDVDAEEELEELQRQGNKSKPMSPISQTSKKIAPTPTEADLPSAPVVVSNDQAGKLYRAEERAKGVVSLKTYWAWLKSGALFDSPIFTFIILILLYGSTQGVKVFSELWLGMWSRGNRLDVGLGLGLYFGLVGLIIVLSLVRALFFVGTSARASVRLHNDLLSTLLKAPVNLFFDITPSGRILNRLSNDLDHLDTRLPETGLQLLHAVSQIIGALVLAIYASPYIALIFLPIAILFWALASRLSRTQRELKRFDSVTRSPLFSHFSETLTGLSTIRSFKVMEEFLTENVKLINYNSNFYWLFWMTARWFALRVDTLAVLCQFSICALGLATSSPDNSPVIGLAVAYSLLLTTTVQACTRYFVETQNSMVAVERICDMIDNVPQERQDGRKDFVITKGDVVFENVSTRYRPHLELCVKDVSFSIPGGSRVGLCGRSGSSKSTLGNILFGMLPVEQGRMLIDGVDSTSIGLKELRSQMAVIPQTPVIFSGTMRFALDPWGELNSDEEIWKVLREVEMDEFVKNFGLDSKLDENAASLSVGERQLICIARALLRKCKIVLLDESTASVDAHSDFVVQKAIKQGFEGATIFIIAHRLHTIIQSDLILVMDSGRLREFGTPTELLAMPQSQFKYMWELENNKKQ